jgi:hypothetical protein
MHVPAWDVERLAPTMMHPEPDDPAVPPDIVKLTKPAPEPPDVVSPTVEDPVTLFVAFEMVNVA